MTEISFEGKSLTRQSDESVLDALLSAGVDLSYGCRSGVCQSCMMVCKEGEVPDAAQKGLKSNQVAQNYFLACQCKPEKAITIAALDAEAKMQKGEVVDKTLLNPNILRLRIKADVDFKAGQYVTLWRDHKIGRSYSLASLPADGFLEFHIKCIDGGAFSSWARDELAPGDEVGVQGPMGLFFYSGKEAESAPDSLVLISIGTGLAPVSGIAKDALAQGYKGSIDLVTGSRRPEDQYLHDELIALSEGHDNFNIHRVAMEGASDGVLQSDIYDFVKGAFSDMKGRQVYLCGAESFVKKMRKQCFLAGAAMQDIHADVFIPAH